MYNVVDWTLNTKFNGISNNKLSYHCNQSRDPLVWVQKEEEELILYLVERAITKQESEK
jgi:hypothetical protein